MRYLLLGYLRRGVCLACRIAVQDPAQLVLLGISETGLMSASAARITEFTPEIPES